MGYGGYSMENRATRAVDEGYAHKSTHEIFQQREIHNKMNPKGVSIRESRDSDDHPNTKSVVLALDVTGSMGSIPHYLVKEGLPKIMGKIMQQGIQDPQMLFLAIGDHECDNSPLQVGQFESNDELLDKWLTDVYLEGGGGGNDGESYLLAWYFAARHTALDSIEKRNEKGFLFTVGDEPTLKSIPSESLVNIMGNGQYFNTSASELLDAAKEIYHVYHLHIKETGSGGRQSVMDGWKQLMGDNLIIVERKEDVSRIIPEIIAKHQSKDTVSSETKNSDVATTENNQTKEEEIL
jgi:hypothetical protein